MDKPRSLCQAYAKLLIRRSEMTFNDLRNFSFKLLLKAGSLSDLSLVPRKFMCSEPVSIADIIWSRPHMTCITARITLRVDLVVVGSVPWLLPAAGNLETSTSWPKKRQETSVESWANFWSEPASCEPIAVEDCFGSMINLNLWLKNSWPHLMKKNITWPPSAGDITLKYVEVSWKGVTPKSSISVGCSKKKHPAIGVPPFVETSMLGLRSSNHQSIHLLQRMFYKSRTIFNGLSIPSGNLK